MKRLFLLLICPPLLFVEAEGQQVLRRVEGIYRVHMGMKNGCDVWIVDGAAVRREIYPEFLYGGNGQRYRFIPLHEIWIDNAVAAEEYEYTLAHELREREIMARNGESYDNAHNSALKLERHMRRSDDSSAHVHEAAEGRVSPTDCDGVKEITDLPDSIVLHNIYRVPLGKRGDVSLWVVDGAAVRRNIYPDFGLSDNDLACHFIPPKEIWIDGQISCEETEFSISAELYERKLMAEGKPYDDAYGAAMTRVTAIRKSASDSASHRTGIIIPPLLDRETGTGDEK
jgi:hypothetical protein